MHELSVARNIVEIVEQHLPSATSRRFKTVRIRVGEIANVVPESLAFCFGALIEGTALQGSSLEIERIPLGCRCRGCHRAFQPSHFAFLCPECGNGDIEIVSGTELNVVEIELVNVEGGP